jgi:hypothetical protein
VRIAILTAAFFLVITCTVQQNSDPLSSNQLDASGREIQRRQSEANKTGAIGAPCVFNFERGEVPNCVFKSANGDIAVARRYLKELVFDSYGMAAVRSSTERWMYVNRKGKVLISGVPVMDNWADTFHDGLVRFVENKRYGFANRKGQIVIPPTYDGAMNFEKGSAEVCTGCQSKCVETDCEHHVFSGGDWILINTKGSVLKRLHPDN